MGQEQRSELCAHGVDVRFRAEQCQRVVLDRAERHGASELLQMPGGLGVELRWRVGDEQRFQATEEHGGGGVLADGLETDAGQVLQREPRLEHPREGLHAPAQAVADFTLLRSTKATTTGNVLGSRSCVNASAVARWRPLKAPSTSS